MSDGPALSPDAAMVLGIAATALPFARTSEAEAERWLWVLRLHGEVGAVLQGLGVGEAPLEGARPGPGSQRIGRARAEGDAIARVTQQAVRLAHRRGAETVGTGDVLVAVMQTYGDDFDQVLRAHGTDGREVIERLASKHSVHAGS